MNTESVTAAQIKEMHVLLTATGLLAYKQDMMDEACIDGRYPTSSKELYFAEAEKIISQLRQKYDACDTMRKKVIAICRQAGMSINGKSDMKAIYKWVLEYGHAECQNGQKKAFNKYTYKELTILITQAEKMLKTYLKAINK